MNEIKVNLKSCDGMVFMIDKDISVESQFIFNVLEDVNENDNENIPLPNVSGDILGKGY